MDGLEFERALSATSDLTAGQSEVDIDDDVEYGQGKHECSVNQSMGNQGAEDSGIDGESADGLGSESDILHPLPIGWPKLPQIFRRRSCEFTKAIPVCVQKAKAHLELLQTSIENWCKEKQHSARSRNSTARGRTKEPQRANSQATSSLPSQSRGLSIQQRKELRFASPGSSILSRGGRALTAASSRLTSGSSNASSEPDLSVIGYSSQKDGRPQIVPQGLEADIPYLGAEDVVNETITLLARLENNRRETHDALLNETERVQTLRKRIDGMSYRRMIDIPASVQNEHDACAEDIKELRWHVAYNGRIRDRYKRKVGISETMHVRLKEDITFVKKHCPLVEEKLGLELEAMAKIKKAKAETTDELNHTIDRQENVSTKSTEASQKAELEKSTIKADLDKVRQELNQISEELADARMTYNSYVHQMNACRQQIKDNEQELIVLEVKSENAKTAEAIQQKKVQDLEGRIRDQEYEHRMLEDENAKLKITKEAAQARCEKKALEMVHIIEMKEQTLKNVLRKNYEREIEIDDMEKRLAKCAKAKVSNEKNITRITKEMERTDEMMKVTLDEFHNVLTINHAIRDQLRSEQDRTSHVEEQLRTTTDALKKQVKEEVHTRNMIQARINTDNTELVKNQGDNRGKKDKVSNAVEELEEALRQITETVEKIRSDFAIRTKAIEALTKELSECEDVHKELESTLTVRLNIVEPEHKQLTDNLEAELLAQQKKLDHIVWRSDMMRDKMKDMTTSVNMINRVWDNTDKKIKELTEETTELSIQLEQSQYLEEELKSDVQKVTARLRQNETHHTLHMKNRTETHIKIQADLKENLRQNKDLAATYRQLQNQYLILKNEFMDRYDERINIESTIKDLKQLHSLQLRMHAALQEYYKFRGDYNKSELHRMEIESNHNGAKVAVLQTNMDDALGKISDFLNSHMDGNTARKMALDALQTAESRVAAGANTGLRAPGKSSISAK